jgi:hypothetical protein
MPPERPVTDCRGGSIQWRGRTGIEAEPAYFLPQSYEDPKD